MTTWKILLVAGLGAALAVGCGDDSSVADSGTPDSGGGVDGGGTDAGPVMVDLPPLQTGVVNPDDSNGIDPTTAMAADFSCVGTNTAPVGGADVDFNLVMKEFNDGNTFEGLHVKFWADNLPDNTPWDAATDFSTDVDGKIAVTAPGGGWYAYRVFAQDGPTPSLEIVGSLQTSEPAPTSPRDREGNSVSRATLNLIPTVFGFRQRSGTALIAGRVEDCAGNKAFGANVQVVRADGTLVMEGDTNPEPHYRYFDGDDFPFAGQEWTHVDGLFAAANIPVTGDSEDVFMRVIGRRTAGAPLEVVGCEPIPLHPDTASIINIVPLRSDGPTCPAL